MKHLATLALCAFASAAAMAQSVGSDSLNIDSLSGRQLGEVVVESKMQRLGTQVSTFIPTSKQKRAAISATDLLARIDIPQLSVAPGGSVTTLAGKAIDIFIDFMPATSQDLQGMKTVDVKRVEYYDFPSDPRFQGKQHVVNFIMQRYEYGGYVKPYAEKCLIAGTAQGSLFSRVQYKRMTFDLALNRFYKEQSHNGSDQWEMFRLPQLDGSVCVFERRSSVDDGDLKQRYGYASLRALYSAANLLVRNSLGISASHYPHNSQSGIVAYTPAIAEPSEYSSESTDKSTTIFYNGYFFIPLGENNSLCLTPTYSFSRTSTTSLYEAGLVDSYGNEVNDNSHNFSAMLSYDHDFGEGGSLEIFCSSNGNCSHTVYAGTAEGDDENSVLRYGPGAQYSLSLDKFYGRAGMGYDWDHSKQGGTSRTTRAPWADLSLQFSPNDSHSLGLEYHRGFFHPSESYLSDKVVQRDPLMSYTGNPALRPYYSNDLTLSYAFMPNSKLSLSAFGYAWTIENRYVFDYQASPTGILRTLRQPGGAYSFCNFGVRGSLRLFDRKLQISAILQGTAWHSGGKAIPLDGSDFLGYVRANLYLGNWNFGAFFYSGARSLDNFYSPAVTAERHSYKLSAGWANSKWNIQCHLNNFMQWNWKSDRTVMKTPSYDSLSQAFSQTDHCFIKLAVAYTFTFGKKVDLADNSIPDSPAASGIMR